MKAQKFWSRRMCFWHRKRRATMETAHFHVGHTKQRAGWCADCHVMGVPATLCMTTRSKHRCLAGCLGDRKSLLFYQKRAR